MRSYVITYELRDAVNPTVNELMINAERLEEAFALFKRDYSHCRMEDFRGDDVLSCDDCEYKDSAQHFYTASGAVCPKCGSRHVSGTA